MAELSGAAGYLMIIFLLFAVFFSVWSIGMKKKVGKIESKISVLQEQNEEASEDLNQRIAALRKSTDDALNQLLTKFNGALEKLHTNVNENRKSVLGEASDVIKSAQASIKASFDETKDAINKEVTDSRKELKEFSKKFEDLSKDVEKMRIDLQERTIDLEL